MFMRIHKRRQGGFTLVELIIVLAIIAILSALALSRIGYNRTKAANTTCNAIMGDVKKAAEAYYAESGTKFTADIVANCALIAEGYMAGVPKQPHGSSVSGNYSTTWEDGETATVHCPNETTEFPDGH